MLDVEIGQRIHSMQQLKMAQLEGARILPCDLPDTLRPGSTQCKDKGTIDRPCKSDGGISFTSEGLRCPRQKGDIVAIPMEVNTPVQLVAETV